MVITRATVPSLVQVDAKPVARSFRWFFNSSGGSFEIPSAKPLMSFMNYAESDGGECCCCQVAEFTAMFAQQIIGNDKLWP